jgi:hypothetical protein
MFCKAAIYMASFIFLVLLLSFILQVMPCSAIDLEPYKAEIVDLYTKNIPCDFIVENLSRTYNITVSKYMLCT